MDRSLPPPEALDACAERLEQLNSRFHNLASELSREGVTRWRQAVFLQQGEHQRPVRSIEAGRLRLDAFGSALEPGLGSDPVEPRAQGQRWRRR